MTQTADVLNWIIRIAGIILVILGIIFWTGNWLALIPLHMLIGLIFVVALIILGILAFFVKAPGAAVSGIVWGLIIAWLGASQWAMLPGGAHWIVQVLHLLVGLAGIGIAQVLVKQIAPRPA